MKTVAKVVLVNGDGKYLLLRRSGHPMYPADADIPGGLIESNESPVAGALREVIEETGIVLNAQGLHEVYAGNQYSVHETMKYLYVAKIDATTPITLSWEHASYEWVSRDEFLKQAENASDTYMHLVHEELSKNAIMPHEVNLCDIESASTR